MVWINEGENEGILPQIPDHVGLYTRNNLLYRFLESQNVHHTQHQGRTAGNNKGYS